MSDAWLAKVLEVAGEHLDVTVVVDGQVLSGQTMTAAEYQERVVAAAKGPLKAELGAVDAAGNYLHLGTTVFPSLGPKVRSPVYWRIDATRISAYSLARWDPNAGSR